MYLKKKGKRLGGGGGGGQDGSEDAGDWTWDLAKVKYTPFMGVTPTLEKILQ
jgi:hypothetical protein